jgi:hypothetical protein
MGRCFHITSSVFSTVYKGGLDEHVNIEYLYFLLLYIGKLYWIWSQGCCPVWCFNRSHKETKIRTCRKCTSRKRHESEKESCALKTCGLRQHLNVKLYIKPFILLALHFSNLYFNNIPVEMKQDLPPSKLLYRNVIILLFFSVWFQNFMQYLLVQTNFYSTGHRASSFWADRTRSCFCKICSWVIH